MSKNIDKRPEHALKLTLEERDKEREAHEKQWEQVKTNDKLTRKLCLDILAKWNIGREDIDESLKKNAVSFEKLSTDKLIAEAQKKRKEYDEERTNIMKGLFDELTDAKRQISNLEAHNIATENKISQKNEQILVLKDLIKETKKVQSSSNQKSAVMKAQRSKADVQRQRQINKEAEALAEKEEAKKLQQAQEQLNSIETKYKNQIEDIKPNTIKRLANELIKNEKYELAKNVFCVMCRTGKSLKQDIIKDANKKRLEATGKELVSETPFNNAFQRLIELGLISEGSFTDAITKRTFYEVTGTGSSVFFELDGKEPKESEYSKVSAYHDNPSHGYGILGVANIMREYKKRFSHISEFNRGNQGVILDVNMVVKEDGKSKEIKKKIFPDIAFTEDNEERYLEYELVTQQQQEYNEKIEKYIMHGEKGLYFVFPKVELKASFQKIIQQYLKLKLKEGVDFSDIKFYLYTFKEFEKMCQNGEDWVAWDMKTINVEEEKNEEEIPAEDKKSDKKSDKKYDNNVGNNKKENLKQGMEI